MTKDNHTPQPAQERTAQPCPTDKSAPIANFTEPRGLVVIECACGFKTEKRMYHYDKFRCTCGAWFWAIRPKSGGPLVAAPYIPPEQWERDREGNLIEPGKRQEPT